MVETPKHLSQYRTVISELREEIARLKVKMKDSGKYVIKSYLELYCFAILLDQNLHHHRYVDCRRRVSTY